MTVTCLLSQTNHDLRCPVCGQGVLLFAEHATASVREQVKRRVRRALRSHHAGTAGSFAVHPTETFPVEDENTGVPEWLSSWLPVTGMAAAFA